MSIIVQPRALSLDSSLIIKLWQEWENGDGIAKRLVEKITSSETRLLFTLHHISELVAHESDSVVERRSRFIAKLGEVFWIGGSEFGNVGDFLDLASAELKTWMRLGDVQFIRLITEAREEVIQFGSSMNVADLTWFTGLGQLS